MKFNLSNTHTHTQGTLASLVESYCLHGNIAGATTLLDHMKNLDLPINENIYASLITGHGRSGNMERAEGIIRIMLVRGYGLLLHRCK